MSPSLLRIIKSISLRFVLVAGIFLLALFLFGAIAEEMVLENENGLDRLAFRLLASITSPAMTSVMTGITFFGSSYFLLPAYVFVIALFLFGKKNHRLSWNIAAIGLSSTIILFSLKAIFHRHRPPDPLVPHVDGFSFPSGHSLSAFVFFGLLIYILWQQGTRRYVQWGLSVLFFLFACAVALSRVYLHVHYASDVVAGFLLCIVWLGFSFGLLRFFEKKYGW